MWLSSSFISCKVAAGVLATRGQIVTSGVGVGSMSESFTFDAPEETFSAKKNGPSTGTILISVSGADFGTVGFTLSERLGDSAAENSKWTSYTSAFCRVCAKHIG